MRDSALYVVAGPEERKFRSKLCFMLTGHWPNRVVQERLARLRLRELEDLEARAEEMICPLCFGQMCAEDSHEGPYVFCVQCGYGGRD